MSIPLPSDMTIVSAHNSATILPHHGGTISHLILENSSGKKIEQLWQRTPTPVTPGAWPDGGIPILFPFAGRVWSNGQVGLYQYHDQEYTMPIHGFLYGLTARAFQKSADQLVLEFGDDETTRTQYPWQFKLVVDYKVDPRSLSIGVSVTNLGFLGDSGNKITMPVALGFHPYFALSASLKNIAKDLSINLSAKSAFAVTSVGNCGKIFNDGPVSHIEIAEKSYQNVILEMIRPDPIYISGKEEGTRTVLRTGGPLNYLVLWGEPESPFFCVEPWMAPPDAPNHHHGTNFLADGESLTITFEIASEPAP